VLATELLEGRELHKVDCELDAKTFLLAPALLERRELQEVDCELDTEAFLGRLLFVKSSFRESRRESKSGESNRSCSSVKAVAI